MDSKLIGLFGLTSASRALNGPLMRQQDIIVGETLSGRAVRRAAVRPDPWLRPGDLRDALTTFALVFVCAMVFLA